MCCYVHSAIFCSVNVFPAQICYISLCLVEFLFFYESSVLSCSFFDRSDCFFFFFSCLLNIPFGSVQFCSVFFLNYVLSYSVTFCSVRFCSSVYLVCYVPFYSAYLTFGFLL